MGRLSVTVSPGTLDSNCIGGAVDELLEVVFVESGLRSVRKDIKHDQIRLTSVFGRQAEVRSVCRISVGSLRSGPVFCFRLTSQGPIGALDFDRQAEICPAVLTSMR
jgi:hypothetical protein